MNDAGSSALPAGAIGLEILDRWQESMRLQGTYSRGQIRDWPVIVRLAARVTGLHPALLQQTDVDRWASRLTPVALRSEYREVLGEWLQWMAATPAAVAAAVALRPVAPAGPSHHGVDGPGLVVADLASERPDWIATSGDGDAPAAGSYVRLATCPRWCRTRHQERPEGDAALDAVHFSGGQSVYLVRHDELDGTQGAPRVRVNGPWELTLVQAAAVAAQLNEAVQVAAAD
jgi:hypothetical protein